MPVMDSVLSKKEKLELLNDFEVDANGNNCGLRCNIRAFLSFAAQERHKNAYAGELEAALVALHHFEVLIGAFAQMERVNLSKRI